MKKYFKSILKNISILLKRDKSIIIFPILFSIVVFLQYVMSVAWDVSWVTNFDIWATSFITSLFLYMLLDVILENIKLFRKFKKIKTVVSFVISTFIGETIKYSLRDNILWWHYIVYGVLTISFGFLLIFIMGFGMELGKDKATNRIQKEIDEYQSEIKNMTKEEKETLMRYSKRALRIDDRLFEFIVTFKSKEMIKQIVDDVKR